MTARLPDDVRGQRTLDAVDVMDELGAGSVTVADAIELTGATELVDGLREYANYLEAVLVTRGNAVPDVRRAARVSARRLIARAGNGDR